ncbi:DUF4407 domain-containing protein [Tenacibaculum sp. 190524A02b]|uniref:DUF4407 domain-containing protein n=1 Tax=Tenacibaculum vairaonense TaxID=3137860 RepID=UPI0031FA50B3
MLKQFFLICSGVDLDIIKKCSNGEQNKYVGIGATVFFTALMASLAGSYALYTVFDNLYSAIFFGFVWGLLIFNLDRFIVSTIRKKENFRTEFIQVVPRLLLATIIAIVISKPLELKIFEKEINQVLLEEKNAMILQNKEQISKQFSTEIQGLQTEIQGLKNEINEKETSVNALYETYIAEAEGRKGTKLLGKGPVYKEKREKHDKALLELNELKQKNAEKIKEKESAIKDLIASQKQKEADTQPIISSVDGLMARTKALQKLPWLPSFFIFLLFLAIETAPIFTKLISAKSEYDYKFEEQEAAVITWIKQQTSQQELLLYTDKNINNKVYKDLEEEEELYNYKKQKAEELLKLQADTFYKKQQKII